MSYAKELSDIALRLAQISDAVDKDENLGVPAGGTENQVEMVSRVFDGQPVSQEAPTASQQREAVQSFQPRQQQDDGPRQTPCKFCGAPIFMQQSKNGKWYTTNSPRRNDFHDCDQRPSR
tara:strand:+ start:1438 stop:1797 length:360 start_codon:yes stop_codon:yes gene_type:complete